MAAQTFTQEVPAQIRAGDSVGWVFTLPDYPASDGWAVTWYLVPASGTKLSFVATGSGQDHTATRTAAQTATWAPTSYTVAGVATKGTDRATIYTGTLTVLPDIAAADTIDSRSFAKKMLDAIEAALLGRATASQLDLVEVQVYSRAQKRDRSALIEARDKFKAEVQREDAAGSGRGRGRIQMRF